MPGIRDGALAGSSTRACVRTVGPLAKRSGEVGEDGEESALTKVRLGADMGNTASEEAGLAIPRAGKLRPKSNPTEESPCPSADPPPADRFEVVGKSPAERLVRLLDALPRSARLIVLLNLLAERERLKSVSTKQTQSSLDTHFSLILAPKMIIDAPLPCEKE